MAALRDTHWRDEVGYQSYLPNSWDWNINIRIEYGFKTGREGRTSANANLSRRGDRAFNGYPNHSAFIHGCPDRFWAIVPGARVNVVKQVVRQQVKEPL
jgi:hypothetical protein